jgi:hypothetical protein
VAARDRRLNNPIGMATVRLVETLRAPQLGGYLKSIPAAYLRDAVNGQREVIGPVPRVGFALPVIDSVMYV